MKAKLTLLSLVGLMAGGLACLGQDSAPAPQAASSTTDITAAAPAVETAATAPATVLVAAEDAAPAAVPAATPPATTAAEPATAAPATEPATPAATVAPVDATPKPAATNETKSASLEVIPLIVMDDVGLIDAIKNLARQAALNYVLDPKVPYGAIDPQTGKPTPQPTISIRWENLTAQQALLALLNNYNLIIVDDPKTSIARITVKDPAAPDPLVTTTIQLKYTSPTNMAAIVQSSMTDKRGKVLADVRTSQLVVVATEKDIIMVNDLVAKLDTPTKQVLIEAKIVETSKNPRALRGIDWSGTVEAQKFAAGNNTFTPATSVSDNRLVTGAGVARLLVDTAKGFNPATAFLDADGLSAVFSFLNKDDDTTVISTPRAVTLDNELATLSVTRAEPIFKNTAGTQGSPGGSEVTYTNLGTILNVTPRISADHFIQLHVLPEVSSVGPVRTKTVAGTENQADSYDIRKIETRVLIPSGNTLVMGGLISDDTKNSNTKVPLLGDIPGLGWAFRSEGKNQLRKNLVIFITPTIVQDNDFAPTETSFLKTEKPADVTETKNSAYWSAKPYDWSKVGHNDSN